jgi:putative transposase
MPNTYIRVYIQAVFGVKYRNALIEKSWKPSLMAVMGNLINETGCTNLIVNGVDEHVHCFFELKPSVSISEIMKTVKAKSSKFINENMLTEERFEWQKGYGAFSYSQHQVKNIFDYVQNQDFHHQKCDFHSEYQQLLIENNIQFDPKYYFEQLI